MTVNWPRFAEVVAEHDSILLTSHIRPDCDALGSELAMAAVLEAAGKKVTIVNGQATPPGFAFLDPAGRIKVIGQTVQPADLEDVTLIMILDTSAWAQLGPMAEYIQSSSVKKIVVDHHVGEDDLDAELFKNTTAEAAGRLVLEAADALGVTLTKEIAVPAFTAMATDTGWFRFPSVTAYTYELAARCLNAGVVPAEIYGELYERETAARLKLRGLVLARVREKLEGMLVYTHITQEDFQETGAHPSDTEDLINLTLAIKGTQGAFILIEQPDGRYKLSLRSRGKMDCNQVARMFEGGGHKAAAGATLTGTLDDCRVRVLDAVIPAMR